VATSIRRVLPPSVQEEINVESSAWVDELDRLLRIAGQILEQGVTAYGGRRDQAVAARKYWLADMYQKVIRNLTQRELLGVLANRNVLPKYGFPVDTVELRIPQDGGGVSGQLELTRDLSAAVHEYAPGAEIVAGGHLWASAGVYRLPDRELVSRCYTVCGTCGRYREATEPRRSHLHRLRADVHRSTAPLRRAGPRLRRRTRTSAPTRADPAAPLPVRRRPHGHRHRGCPRRDHRLRFRTHHGLVGRHPGRDGRRLGGTGWGRKRDSDR
jgi:hypothetical protein